MKATIYTKQNCVFCDKVKAIAEQINTDCQNFDYELISREENHITLEMLSEKAGKELKTSPQIWIDDKHIGGYTEFNAYICNAITKGTLNFK